MCGVIGRSSMEVKLLFQNAAASGVSSAERLAGHILVKPPGVDAKLELLRICFSMANSLSQNRHGYMGYWQEFAATYTVCYPVKKSV